MLNLCWITENIAVSGQIQVADLPALHAQGFNMLICNRPDGEDAGQPTAASLQAAAVALGFSFHHLPMTTVLPPAHVATTAQLLNDNTLKILAYCRSGGRSSALIRAALPQ